ncbi:MAG: putative lipid II flippase FtsW [Nitrincola lacisaponensis]|uniref:Probable peptidoglycan glycosyltransferase FtsW n=1 Tax=Nitrincola lacisaponensis TaxID=267850 RepID=A0A063Y3S1_9GAMM|nr:putative lipid II flippase FtsW [Nitrincola lacisaponensis]KDE40943.1 Cell division protein FtsW [Nitrincola lacisaponensis]
MSSVSLKSAWPAFLDMPAGRLSFDPFLLLSVLALMLTGFVMIASASMDVAARDFGSPYFFIIRHGIFVVMAMMTLAIVSAIPMRLWQQYSVPLLVIGGVSLLLVLVPGIGREVNGARRWISLGFFNLQVSELAKIFMVIYIAGYLVRRLSEVRSTWSGVMKPVLPLSVYVGLLISQPDFGVTVVLMCTVMGMVFLSGMRLFQFIIVLLIGVLMAGLLAVTQPYRVQRLKTFLDPWADPFGAGYQLSQAQIAFGRGEWFGTGLGNSVQKLFYLPEAHTDFIYSILAEELGLVGALIVILLYCFLVYRIFVTGRRAEKQQQFFMGYVCYGFAFIFAGQALINIGVNVGALPTKGLTLPLLSYGGSSLLASAIMIAIVLRIDYELKRATVEGQRGPRRTRKSAGRVEA